MGFLCLIVRLELYVQQFPHVFVQETSFAMMYKWQTNVHKLRFKAIFGLESTISATSVQYFIFLLGFGIFQISQVFGFVFSEMSVALGWSSEAPVPLTKDSQLSYP